MSADLTKGSFGHESNYNVTYIKKTPQIKTKIHAVTMILNFFPVNKLKRLVAPNGPPLILSIPRCSHPAPPYISNTFPRQCLRRVVFRLHEVAKGRVVKDGFIQNRVVWGRVIKDRVSQVVIFENRIVMGQIVQKRMVKNRVVLGQI